MKTKYISTKKAQKAFDAFYLEFEHSFPNISKYVTKDVLQIAWNSGVIWAVDNTLQELNDAINQ